MTYRQVFGPSTGGDDEADGRAGAGAGLQGQVSVDEEGALSHTAETEAAVGFVEGEAAAVVEDGQLDLRRPVAQRHGNVLGAGVAGGVGERLLGDPVDDQLGVVAEVGEVALDLDRRLGVAGADRLPEERMVGPGNSKSQ